VSGIVQTLRQFVSPGSIEGYFAVKYAEFAKNTEDIRNDYRRHAALAAAEVQEGKVLEVGPGPGYIAIELARLAPDLDIVGLDISETMIEIATRNAVEEGVAGQIAFRRGDAAQMPFEDSEFNLVLSNGSLHHWREPARVFAEICRVLKPGCRAMISDLRKDAPQDEVEALASNVDSRFMRWGLKHSVAEAYTAREIEELVNGIPFAELEVEIVEISMLIWLRK
jgi:ubiquinone/menaquinone biosynthesis C-methylase UbiE